MKNLAEKVIRGGGWISGLRVTQKVIGFGKSIVLARILAPSDFGLFAIATLVLAAFQSLTKAGINQAVVQQPEPSERFLQTAYWIKVLRGLLLGVAIYVSAPWVAEFFGNSAATPIVRLLAIYPVLTGCESIGIALLHKGFLFKRFTIFRFFCELALVGSSIVLAVILQNAYALAWGFVIGAAVQVFLSFLFHRFRPRLQFDLAHAREIISFGTWLLLAATLQYISLQADDIFLGKWAGSRELGLYQMAFIVANIVAQEFSGIMRTVLLPAFSELQESMSRSGAVLSRAYTVTALLVFPAAIGLAVVAPYLVTTVFGDKWHGVALFLPFLAASAIFRALSSITHAFFIGIGKPKLMFAGDLVRTAVLVIALYPCFQAYGTAGVALAAALSTGATLAVLIYQIHLITGALPTLVKQLAPSLCAAGVMGGVVLGIRMTISLHDSLMLVVLVITGVVVYFALSFLFEKVASSDLYPWLWRRLRLRG